MAEIRRPEFHVFNTMTKQQEIFKPRVEGKVGMYVCGVTPYDYSHIGHARAYVSFDVLYRYLKHLGYEVVYVRNFTDVDDKIIQKANDSGEVDPTIISGKFIKDFLDDMTHLQCLTPTHQPRVTKHMKQITDMIKQILEKGYAYPVGDDVYFSVESFPNYGSLSGRKLEDNRAGERVAVDGRKKHPGDFALWKAAKPGEPHWDSPLPGGLPGRPGWHIECSAMSSHYLTHEFDIHGGGMDLMFPHHENEIAQSWAACSESNVRYWMHNEFVNVKEEKMSKSLKNFVTIRQITEKYHPLALRYFLLRTHYRNQVNYSESEIDIASETLFYVYQTLQDSEDFRLKEESGVNGLTVGISPADQECINKVRNGLESQLANDLHTPTILTDTLQEALRKMNSSLNKLKKKQQEQQRFFIVMSLSDLQQHLSIVKFLGDLEKEVKEVLDVLGLLSKLNDAEVPYKEVLQQLKDKAIKRAGLTENEILHSIKERQLARQNKDYSKSDQIRKDLKAKGIDLMDEKDGKETNWKPCVPVPELPAQQDNAFVPAEN